MEVMKFVVAQSLVVLLCTSLTYHITEHQPASYMDEIFHIPQAQKYCNGSFEEWDPKITTLPGLYLFSIGLLKLLQHFTSYTNEQICTVLNLRLVNSVFCAGNLYLLFAITELLHKKNPRENYPLLKAITLSFMPLLFFFNILYYTDAGSLFFVLYAYYYHLRGSYSIAAILGMVSIIFRQTNIVWVFFMALCNVSRNIHRQMKLESKNKHTAWSLLTHSLPVFIINIIVYCWGYAIVGATAIAFVLWNGSVVVGDKSAHEASFNPPQIGYFLCFTLGLSCFHLITADKIRQFLSNVWTHKLVYFLIAGVSVVLVHKFTQVHPYLLADNRHYTFYVWSKFFARFPWGGYALIPLYLYGMWSVDNSLQHVHWMIRCCLWLCIGAALVPQKLMEFRYFVVPYMVIRLHMRDEMYKRLLLEMFVYLCINAFTVYRFLYKPIFWPHIHEPQRLMW